MIQHLLHRCAFTRGPRTAGLLMLDALAITAALQGALALRFEGSVPAEFARAGWRALPLLLVIRLAILVAAGLHRWSFRMSGLSEAVRLVGATLLGTLLFAAAARELVRGPLPTSLFILEFLMSAAAMGALRFLPRLVDGWLSEQQRRSASGAVRTIIVGAGNAGDLLARDLLRSRDSKYYLVGFADDDRAKLGTSLNGKPVLGTLDELPRLIARHEVSMVLLAIARIPAERIRAILDMCKASRAKFKIIPCLSQLDERVTAAMLHDLSPEDLLPRDAVAFDESEIQALVAGRRALVTGAGGSIGGEICRQLAGHGVSTLVLVDMNENELYLKARSFQTRFPGVRVHCEVADVREFGRLERLGQRYRPEFVFHAAAHKHVPLMEDAPEEAVKNNVFGTLNVARMASQCGAERFVLISTDKAVRPSSVMGATKRIAELVVRDLARTSSTRMTAVRFGNVLGSAGSVVPLFKQQIERGGPVTVTHPECTRYFMTIPEAVGLVLLAGLSGYGELCVLDMGEPIKIADLARSLITMAGYIPDEEIPIVYSGLRPGEKLYEELLTEEEEQTRHVRDRILVARSPAPPSDFHERLRELRKHADGGDHGGVLRAIRAIVPTYAGATTRPSEIVVSEQLAEVVQLKTGTHEVRA